MTEIVTLGAGRMGRGIAQAFAYAGHPVTILDFKARSAAECEQLLREAVSYQHCTDFWRDNPGS